MTRNPDPAFVAERLAWMRSHCIWPNGLRYLWTDAFGVVLLVALYRHTGDRHWLREAEAVVTEVNAVLGRPRGLRIGGGPTATASTSIIWPCGCSPWLAWATRSPAIGRPV